MADWTLSTVMDGIASYAIAQGVVTRAYGYPAANPQGPCLVVGYPTKLNFDFTFHAAGTAGSAELTFPLWFLVSKVIDKAARDDLSAVITGLSGIKDKLDSMTGSGVNTARIVDMTIEKITVGAIDWLAAKFDYDVVVS